MYAMYKDEPSPLAVNTSPILVFLIKDVNTSAEPFFVKKLIFQPHRKFTISIISDTKLT